MSDLEPVAGLPDFPTDLTSRDPSQQFRREIRQPLGCYQPLPNRNAQATALALRCLWHAGTTKSRDVDRGLDLVGVDFLGEISIL